MQSHHVRLPEVRGRVGGVAGLATRALVVTALVGATGAYLHAGSGSDGDSATHSADRFSAAAAHEVAPAADTAPGGASTELGAPTLAATEPHLAGATVLTSVTQRPATLVHVFHDGCASSVMTTARTVDGALAQAKVTVGAHDIVRPGLSAAPRAGMGIHVVRVRTHIVHAKVTLPSTTIRKADAHLAKGHSKVVRKGHTGVAKVTYKVVLHDGKEHSRKVIRRTVITAPLATIVHYGTKKAASRSKRGVDSLNWHALAVCESGDNPRAVGGGGSYFGLYQFTVGTWHSVGGSGSPKDASRAEQTKRAKILYGRRGASPWPVCGSKLYS